MGCEVFNESDIAMIEGGQQTIQVNIYDILGEGYINIAIDKVEWRMSHYGETECLLSKKSSEDSTVQFDDNVITITILASDTLNLFGKFTHQAIITDMAGKQFVLDLGKISIKPMIR